MLGAFHTPSSPGNSTTAYILYMYFYHVTILALGGETLEGWEAPYPQALVTSRGVRENAQKDPESLGTQAPWT